MEGLNTFHGPFFFFLETCTIWIFRAKVSGKCVADLRIWISSICINVEEVPILHPQRRDERLSSLSFGFIGFHIIGFWLVDGKGTGGYPFLLWGQGFMDSVG